MICSTIFAIRKKLHTMNKAPQLLSTELKVRMTEKQRKQLEKFAKQHGLSMAEYIREVVFG